MSLVQTSIDSYKDLLDRVADAQSVKLCGDRKTVADFSPQSFMYQTEAIGVSVGRSLETWPKIDDLERMILKDDL